MLIGHLLKNDNENLQKGLKECVQKVADKMHHTASICKKNYLNPELMKMYLERNEFFYNHFKGNTKDKICDGFLKFLKDTYQ